MTSVIHDIFGNNLKSKDLIRTLLQFLCVLFGEPLPSHRVVLCIIAYSHSRRQMFYRDNVWSQDWKASLMIPTALISCGNCFVIIHTWLEWGVDRSHHVPYWVLQNWALGEMIREEGLLSCHNLPTWQGLFSFTIVFFLSLKNILQYKDQTKCGQWTAIIITITARKMIKYLTMLPVRRYVLTIFIQWSPEYVSPVTFFHGLQIRVLKNERCVRKYLWI